EAEAAAPDPAPATPEGVLAAPGAWAGPAGAVESTEMAVSIEVTDSSRPAVDSPAFAGGPGSFIPASGTCQDRCPRAPASGLGHLRGGWAIGGAGYPAPGRVPPASFGGAAHSCR